MTAPLRSIPASQNTAPVAEFRCLFTHDIRRKQKRWQDGYLKFHTFNNRVMVYDQTRYFLGDTYYKDSNELHEGDELTLDKGIMVEVADAIRVTQTDLTPLFDKKPKESPARPNPTAPPRPFQPPSSVASSNASRATSQMRHKSLNTLLGTPKGPIGKSVPMQSPYEARKEKEKENECEEERASKRHKTTQYSAISKVSSHTVNESSAPKENLPLWARTSDAKSARAPPKPLPQGAAVIMLDSSPDRISVISSDITLPHTSPGIARSRPKSPTVQPPPIMRQAVLENPVAKTPKIPRGKVPVPHVKAMETPKQPVPTSSPPVSASNRLTNVDFALQSAQKPSVEKSSAQHMSAPKLQKELAPPPSPPCNPKMKSLRLSAGVKRGVLLCQSLPQQASSAGSQLKVSAARHQTMTSSKGSKKDPLSLVDPRAQPAISTKKPASSKRKALKPPTDEVSKRARMSASPLSVSPDIFDDPEVVHGLLGQQSMIPSSPVGFQHPGPSPSSPVLKVPKSKSAEMNRPARKEADTRKPSPPADPALEVCQSPPPGETSLARPDTFQTHSRNSSASPCRLSLSPAGFHNESECNQPQSTILTAAPKSVPVSRNETVALPPHPLRAGRKGPLMTTTELAALLKKPKKTPKDPILDEEHQPHPGKPPARSFRRVRSENDTPIPSISEEWERRNIPNPPTTDVESESVQVEAKKKPGGLAALVKKTDPRRRFQHTKSLIVNANVSVEEGDESDLPSPVVDKDIGPWSTEAFDLFDWRPPLKG